VEAPQPGSLLATAALTVSDAAGAAVIGAAVVLPLLAVGAAVVFVSFEFATEPLAA